MFKSLLQQFTLEKPVSFYVQRQKMAFADFPPKQKSIDLSIVSNIETIFGANKTKNKAIFKRMFSRSTVKLCMESG